MVKKVSIDEVVKYARTCSVHVLLDFIDSTKVVIVNYVRDGVIVATLKSVNNSVEFFIRE